MKQNQVRQYIKKGLSENKRIIVAILLLNLILAASSVVQPLIFQALFDDVLPDSNYQKAIVLITIMVLIPIIFTILNAITSYFNNRLGNVLSKIMRKEIFQRIIHSKYDYLQKVGEGEIINRITQQIGQFCELFVVQNLMKILTNIIMLVITISVMLSLNLHLTIIAIIFFPLFVILLKLLQKKTRMMQMDVMKKLDEAVNYLQAVFRNLKSIHIFTGQKKEIRNWDDWLEGNWNARNKSNIFYDTFTNISSEVLMSTMTGIVYAYSLFLVFNDRLTVGALLAFIMLLPRIYNIFRDLFLSGIEWERMKVIINNLNEILAITPIPEGTHLLNKSETYDLRLRSVNFQYPDEGSTGLTDINLDIKYGEFIGIVGMSGSGKSTLFDLIHHHLESDSGEILLNEKSVSAYTLEALRSYIGYNPQNLGLWNLSLLENIIYPLGVDELDDEKKAVFAEVVRMAQVDHFVSMLPEKYETVIQNNGENFSGGEVQRILLARTLFHQPNILLLDEYTSALDAITEKALNETFVEIAKKQTLLVIAHRLATVIDADKIIVINDGKIVEAGTKDELLDLKGIFYDMYQSQKI